MGDKLQIKIPGKDAPGYLLRQKRALEFRAAIGAENPEPTAYDKLIDFLVDFVVEPQDRKLAREMLWQASEQEIDDILARINGKDAEPPLSK